MDAETSVDADAMWLWRVANEDLSKPQEMLARLLLVVLHCMKMCVVSFAFFASPSTWTDHV